MNPSVLQKKAAVDMLRAMVHCGRAKQADLDRAELELSELQNEARESPRATAYSPAPVEPIPKPVSHSPQSNPLSQTAAISQEIDRLQRQMAGLSNELHHIPETVPCPGLTSQIIALKTRIEDLWTKKHLLDRNRTSAPSTTAVVDEQPPQASPEDETLLLQLTHERQRLADKRSKLRKKLTDPRKSVAKNAEWSQELAKVEHELNAKDVEIQLVRTRL